MQSAKINIEKMEIPDCSYPLPPYKFMGEGITLIYEIPFNRVKNIIPPVFKPDPGKRKIWFLVSFYNWKSFFPLSDPDDKDSFFEAYYKFSVRYKSRLGDYPVKLYLTSRPGIAGGIKLYGYPKYPAQMRFEMGNGTGHFVIERNGRSELKIEMKKARGISSIMTTFFANAMARSYLKKYAGNFLFKNDNGEKKLICGPTNIINIRYQLGETVNVYLREPLEWNILTASEIQKPKYSFILTDITADLGPPQTL